MSGAGRGPISVHTENRITVQAPRHLVYEIAADIERWPEILDHYRYVRLLGVSGQWTSRVTMAASRSGIPVRWTSLQHRDPGGRSIRYEHIAGVTKGMDVVWWLQSSDGGTSIVIEHDLPNPRWWLRPRLSRLIVGTVFIKHVADRTLRGVKRAAEARVAEVPV